MALLLAMAGISGCSERAPFDPTGGNGGGGGGGGGGAPVTTIDEPSTDTILTAGPNYFVQGLTTDPAGVKTVYFNVVGGLSGFPPLDANSTSVRWGLPLATGALAGRTITVSVYGVDSLGTIGNTAVRSITIQ
jgi:hypothetical protein